MPLVGFQRMVKNPMNSMLPGSLTTFGVTSTFYFYLYVVDAEEIARVIKAYLDYGENVHISYTSFRIGTIETIIA